MKRFLTMLLVAASCVWTACDPPVDRVDPNPSPYYEFPLKVQKDGFKAGANGVSVTVTDIEEQNIIFTLNPGDAVASYRVDVYPKALIYNMLLEQGLVEGETDACEDVIIQLLLSSTSGACKHVFNKTNDYALKEFDWANTTYTEALLVPDCDYYIMVLGCYDQEGTNPASLSLCEVTTKAKPIIGDPYIGIEAITGHTAFIVKYHPNADCKYFYHWIWSTEELGKFIDLFGDRMMRDFCRSVVSAPLDASDDLNLAIKQTFPNADQVIRANTAVAVAVDANLTPSVILMRNDFELIQKPVGDFAPVATVGASSRVSATMAFLSAHLEKTAESCFYRVVTKPVAEQLKAASKEQKEAEARSLANEGYGVANPRFAYDSDFQTLTGSDYSTDDLRVYDLVPDTEYVVVSVAKNRFGELSDLVFSSVFKTKPLITTAPGASLAEVTLTFTDISRWGMTYNFSYDYTKTMCFRFQIVYPFDEDDPTTSEDDNMHRPPHYINDADKRDKWVEFLYGSHEGPAGPIPNANLWDAEPSGRESLADFGYESGVKYVIAYCAEDINGVVGPVRFAEATTTAPVPGPNPKVSFEGLSYNPSTGEFSGRIVANQDSKMIRYFVVASGDGSIYNDCALPYLATTQRNTYDQYLTIWKGQLIQNGLSTAAESAAVSGYADKDSDNPVLIAAISIGEENYEDVYSPVAAKIIHKGQLKDLSDFRTPPAK